MIPWIPLYLYDSIQNLTIIILWHRYCCW